MRTRSRSRTTIAVGAALAALTALFCLALAGARDPETLSLSDLNGEAESLLMSCESSTSTSSTQVLLWCADPTSPQCIPAAPSAPHIELGDRPDLALLSGTALAGASFVLVPWPSIDRDRDRGTSPSQRVERPPRS